MRAIIAGGSGLIGSALAKKFSNEGREVIILSRYPSMHKNNHQGIIIEKWDGYSSKGWVKYIDDSTAIINLSGANISGGRWTKKRKNEIRESRINSGKALSQAILESDKKPYVLIQASAVGYYGSSIEENITEDHPAGRGFLSQTCADWEDSTRHVEKYGVRRVIIRQGVVLSKQSVVFKRMVLPYKLFAGGPIGKGTQWFPWIHEFDLVNAIRFLVDNDQTKGPYNLTSPGIVTNNDFAKSLGKITHRPVWFPIPEFGLKIIFGEMASILLEGQQVIPQKLTEKGFMFKYPTIVLALQDLVA